MIATDAVRQEVIARPRLAKTPGLGGGTTEEEFTKEDDKQRVSRSPVEPGVFPPGYQLGFIGAGSVLDGAADRFAFHLGFHAGALAGAPARVLLLRITGKELLAVDDASFAAGLFRGIALLEAS